MPSSFLANGVGLENVQQKMERKPFLKKSLVAVCVSCSCSLGGRGMQTKFKTHKLLITAFGRSGKEGNKYYCTLFT